MKTNIRLTTKKDISALAPIFAAAFNKLFEGNYWTESASARLLEFQLRLQPDLFFVAIENNEIVGGVYGMIKPLWDGVHLQDPAVFVGDQHARKGIAKRLMMRLLETAIEKYQAVGLDAYTVNYQSFPLDWHLRTGHKILDKFVMLSGNIKEVLNNLKR